MPALRMKRKFDEDVFGNEFGTKTMKSMKISHFHVDELEQAAVLNSSYKGAQDGKWLPWVLYVVTAVHGICFLLPNEWSISNVDFSRSPEVWNKNSVKLAPLFILSSLWCLILSSICIQEVLLFLNTWHLWPSGAYQGMPTVKLDQIRTSQTWTWGVTLRRANRGIWGNLPWDEQGDKCLEKKYVVRNGGGIFCCHTIYS